MNKTKIAIDFVIGCRVVSGIVNLALDVANIVDGSDSGRLSMPTQSEVSSSLMNFPACCSTWFNALTVLREENGNGLIGCTNPDFNRISDVLVLVDVYSIEDTR